VRVDVAQAIAAARSILRSPMLQGVMNLRVQTRIEKRVGVIASMKRGGSWTRSNAK
jgi:hypothetical protein